MKYRIVVDGAVFSTACCLALARHAARASDGSPAEQGRRIGKWSAEIGLLAGLSGHGPI